MLGKILCRLGGLTTQLRTGLTVISAAFAALAALAIGSQISVNAANGSVSTIKGVGNAGFLSEFLDNYTITDSPIFDKQGKIGIGTVNPQAKLEWTNSIEGTIGASKV